MDLRVKRILSNDIKEHDDVFREVYITVDSIVKIEQSLTTPGDNTEILFSWGEYIVIDENIHKFKDRVDEYNKNKELGIG